MAVDTPVYGLNAPPGSDTTPSSFCSSTSIRRSSLCAFDEPKSTPSGTITAARPPGFSNRKNSARNSSSVFFVLTIACNSFDVFS
ncbi:hypothetical protein D3C72_2305940 [compost metagenome]